MTQADAEFTRHRDTGSGCSRISATRTRHSWIGATLVGLAEFLDKGAGGRRFVVTSLSPERLGAQ